MTLGDKLDLLSLSPEERKKAEEKFLATLALVSYGDLKEVVRYLESKNVFITRAREIKVLGNTKEEIAKKFSILEEIHETDIYVQDPNRISHNVIDIYKKIKYCNQAGIKYRNEDGTYKNFLFNEVAWQAEFSKERSPKPKAFSGVEPDIVTVDPLTSRRTTTTSKPGDDKYIDIKDYMARMDKIDSSKKEMEQPEIGATDFATIRDDLEKELAALDSLKGMGMDEISFNDLEPDSYGLGRAA